MRKLGGAFRDFGIAKVLSLVILSQAFAQQVENDPRTRVFGPDFAPENAQYAPIPDRLASHVGGFGYWNSTTRAFDTFCSGGLVDSQHVLTAAHCFDDHPKLQGQVYFFPGKTNADERNDQYRPIPVVRAWLLKDYYPVAQLRAKELARLKANSADSDDDPYASNLTLWSEDLAVVELQFDAPAAGLSLRDFPEPPVRRNTAVYSLGYPSDLPGGTLWYTHGKTDWTDQLFSGFRIKNVYQAEMKVFPGASGSPVFVARQGESSRLPAIAGVVTRYASKTAATSFGIQLDAARIAEIQALISKTSHTAWRDFDYALPAQRGRLRITVLEDEEGLPIQPGVAVRKTARLTHLTVEIVRVSNQKNGAGEWVSTREIHELEFPGKLGDTAYLMFKSQWQDSDRPWRLIWGE